MYVRMFYILHISIYQRIRLQSHIFVWFVYVGSYTSQHCINCAMQCNGPVVCGTCYANECWAEPTGNRASETALETMEKRVSLLRETFNHTTSTRLREYGGVGWLVQPALTEAHAWIDAQTNMFWVKIPDLASGLYQYFATQTHCISKRTVIRAYTILYINHVRSRQWMCFVVCVRSFCVQYFVHLHNILHPRADSASAAPPFSSNIFAHRTFASISACHRIMSTTHSRAAAVAATFWSASLLRL